MGLCIVYNRIPIIIIIILLNINNSENIYLLYITFIWFRDCNCVSEQSAVWANSSGLVVLTLFTSM